MENMLEYLSAKWLLNTTSVMRHALAIAYEIEIKKDNGDQMTNKIALTKNELEQKITEYTQYDLEAFLELEISEMIAEYGKLMGELKQIDPIIDMLRLTGCPHDRDKDEKKMKRSLAKLEYVLDTLSNVLIKTIDYKISVERINDLKQLFQGKVYFNLKNNHYSHYIIFYGCLS